MDNIQIDIFSSNSEAALRRIVGDTISVQSSLLVTRETAPEKSGFLISSFAPEELIRLVVENGKLVTARQSRRLVGYVLVTPISEFSSLLENDNNHASGGHFIPNKPVCFADFDYIYQIGVVRDASGMGVGGALLKRVMRETRKNLLTDILVSPISNKASLGFFIKNGFREAGLLELSEYRSFGKLKSKVLIWNNPERM
ncbi:MAG: GNAT family N-acetyltransferase [Elusimicrobiales bacterium]|jgi:ribosomal protein S18 acetylase RimI-like enzyme